VSTASTVAIDGQSSLTRTKNLLFGTSIVLTLGFGYLYVTDTRASVHEWLVVPALRRIYPDGEEAHHAGTAALKGLHKFGLHPRERGNPDAKGDLKVEIFGHMVDNPIGTSAGIDKNAEIPSALLALGPGIVEIGGVTPLPQPGNPKPRVFRLPSQNAIVNRYGFNSKGAEHVAMTLRQRVREFANSIGLGIDAEAERMVLDGEAGVPPGSLTPGKLLAVQVTKNKSTPDNDIEAVKRDFAYGIAQLGRYSDIIVVNVSSPNTPGLRALQNVAPLTHILTTCVEAANQVDRKTKPAVLVKVSPDEDSEEQVSGICEAIWQSGVDGVIVGNTTNMRPEPIPKGYILPPTEVAILREQGGYSGPQMFERTLALVKRYRKMLDDGPKSADETSSAPTGSATPERHTSLHSNTPRRMTIFATGGVTNGSQALKILEAGAAVAMVYTAMIYSGSGTITRIKTEMRNEIRKK
jgi:dihydroorotate dehydrogenase